MTRLPHHGHTDVKDDAGFTLVELLVYIVLLGLVLAGVGAIVVQTIKGQRQVVSLSQSAGGAQGVMRSINLGVRNAAGVAADGSAGVGGSSNVLVVHTGGGDDSAEFVCQAWVHVPSSVTGSRGEIWTKTIPVSSTRPAAQRLDSLGAAVAAGGSRDGWTLMVKGVEPEAGPVFDPQPGKVQVSFRTFQTEAGRESEVGTKVSATVAVRLQAIKGNGGCHS